MGVQGLLAGRYELQELLGRGAMGEVWRASDQVLGRLVAVKLLRAEEAADAERFRLEAQTAARLNHPNVVGMYDFGSHLDQLYLVMELIDGWSLAQERSLRGALPPAEAASMAAQAAAGISAAHRQGVIHRDIKPANLMLTTDRTVKVADFGIARFADAAASTLTATGKILGTADYLAPERALGRSAQPASDVYSLGCVLYELLTGRPPFTGATSLAVVQQHVSATPPPPSRLRPEIPQPLSDHVLHLLAKDPVNRPTAEQAADRLARQQRGTPQPPATADTALMAAPPTPPAPVPLAREARTASRRSRPRSRRKLASKAVLCGTGLVVFTAAMALGASLNPSDDDPEPPPSPTPMTATSAPPAHAGSKPPTAAPPTTPPPRGDDDEERDERPGKDGRGKGKGRHSDD
ncbi:protein kinase [Streptomyces sp. NPDC051913]|uniref:protein kinase domain-containing protein n=1 Tax=Streptomyces sp. NPDC051913 TaxID=3365676 RepID=UPI0037D6A8FF